ncbi:hypothetical protein H8K38_12465 [Undibacterium sp. FT79W]|uniref:hypothetical protein n=1 Tax=Undibacterium sp. FT79W TaxID=2762296 RepID=UPI00164AC3FA|nr:hypothetical protein [Undibacterium sp. FT79W]MBC3878624.1 hypothetical protein [Undibacterium sp. FT79W]
MTIAFAAILAIIIAGIAYVRGLRSHPDAKRSNAGWYGLGVLALLFAGLWASGNAGNESEAYGFGIAIFLAVPVMLLIGVASAIGKAIRKRKDRKQ